jgi:hypothetical protein
MAAVAVNMMPAVNQISIPAVLMHAADLTSPRLCSAIHCVCYSKHHVVPRCYHIPAKQAIAHCRLMLI